MAQIKIATSILNGRRVGRIVDNQSLDGDATVKEALDYGYVVGKPTSIVAEAQGVLKAMIDGVQRDGNGRKIDGYLSVNPFLKGLLADVTDDFDSASCKAVVRARMLKEFNVDTDDWSFIIEGATGTFQIDSITTGEILNEIFSGEAVAVNGSRFNEGDAPIVGWKLPSGETGTVAAGHVAHDATRITVAAEGLADLYAAGTDGDDVTFTVKIGNKVAIKTATFRVGE